MDESNGRMDTSIDVLGHHELPNPVQIQALTDIYSYFNQIDMNQLNMEQVAEGIID